MTEDVLNYAYSILNQACEQNKHRDTEIMQGIDELKILVAADSFAFFTSIAPKLYVAEGEERHGKLRRGKI